MLAEGFVAAVLAGMEDTLDELIDRAPCEAVRTELVELGDHIHSVGARLDPEPVADGNRRGSPSGPTVQCPPGVNA